MATDGCTAARRATLPPVVFVYLAVIVLTWAANWPLMKLALGQVPPLVFVLFCLIGSVALIAPTLAVSGQRLLPLRGERLSLLWVGALQVAGFLICSIIGLAIPPAGRAIVLAYTMPLWAIPIGLWIWPEPSGRTQLIGAAIGFAGLILLFMNPGLLTGATGASWPATDFCCSLQSLGLWGRASTAEILGGRRSGLRLSGSLPLA